MVGSVVDVTTEASWGAGDEEIVRLSDASCRTQEMKLDSVDGERTQ